MKRVAIAVLAGIAVLSTPTAHADNTLEDVGYLDTLNKYDIRHGDFADGDKAVIIGRAACELMDQKGYSALYAAEVEQQLHNMTEADSDDMVGAAIGAFCPWDKV